MDKIEDLDLLSERDIRKIDVVYADPEELAATLSEVFGGTAAQPTRGRSQRGRSQRGGTSGMNTGRIMIIGDKDAKKLLVRAPDEVYKQIEELVATLDQPSEQMKLKRFILQYADAAAVTESVKTAMQEYIQAAKSFGDEPDFDAFTAMPDPRTNSITVVGTEKTFLFVSEILAAIDIPTPDEQKKEFRIFPLDRADAVTVADAINSFATGGGAATGGSRRGRGRSAPGETRELNVHAIADETTNSVMVFGRMEDIDLIEQSVILRYEDSISDRYRIESIAVENVPPSQIVSFIYQFLDQGATPASGSGGRGGSRSRSGRGSLTEDGGPQIVPNDSGKTLIVRGTQRQIDQIRELVQRFDDPDIVQHQVKIIEIPYGQDATRLAADLQQIINQSEEDIASRTGPEPAAHHDRG